MEIRLDHVSASGSCDGYQVLFEAEEDGLGAYVLLQRHFEEPGGDLCYLETHDEDYIGHFRVRRARLDRNRFWLELPRRKAAEVEVNFDATAEKYEEIVRIMRIMIPCIEVAEAEETC